MHMSQATLTPNLKQPKQIIMADHAGFCYGVKMAVDKAFELVDNGDEPVYVLGELIHNPQVIEKLKEKNVKTVHRLEDVPPGAKCLIRAHGVGPEYFEQAKAQGVLVEDATCPDVRRVQERAIQLAEEGYTLVIVGKNDHPEIKGIVSHAQYHCPDVKLVVIKNKHEIATALNGLPRARVGLISQTTHKEDSYFDIVAELAKLAGELKVFNTICPATYKRQYAAEKLADQDNIEFMVVIGGKNSSNTTHLAEVAHQKGVAAIHIETVDELHHCKELEDYTRIGVTAGASTPDFLIEEVLDYLKHYHLQ